MAAPLVKKAQFPCHALGLIAQPHQAKLLAQPLELSLIYQDLQAFFLHKQSLSILL